MTASAFAASNFSDVPSNHWATSYINKMSEGGLIKGYGTGPDAELTQKPLLTAADIPDFANITSDRISESSG